MFWYTNPIPKYTPGMSSLLRHEDEVKYRGWYFYDSCLFTTSLTDFDEYNISDFMVFDALKVWVDRQMQIDRVDGDDHSLFLFEFRNIYTENLQFDGRYPLTEAYDDARLRLGDLLLEYLLATGDAVKIPANTDTTDLYIYLLSPSFVASLREVYENLSVYCTIGYALHDMVELIEFVSLFYDEVDGRVIEALGLSYWDALPNSGYDYSAFEEIIRRNGWAKNYSYFDLAEDLEVSLSTALAWFPILYGASYTGSFQWYEDMLEAFDKNFIVVDGQLFPLGAKNE